MKRIVLVIGTIALTLSAFAEEPTIKGLKLGMSKHEAESRYKGFTGVCTKPNALGDTVCGYSGNKGSLVDIPELETFAGVPAVRILGVFRDGLAHTFLVNFRAADYERVIEAMTQRWGKPAREDKGEVQNRMGARFDQLEHEWMIGGAVFRAKKRSSNVTEGQLALTSIERIKQAPADKAERARSDAKDL